MNKVTEPFKGYIHSEHANRVRDFLANHLNTDIKNIEILALVNSLSSPIGSKLRFNRSVAVLVHGGFDFGGKKHKHLTCDYSTPASYSVMSEDFLGVFIENMNAQFIEPSSENNMGVSPLDFWMSRSHMESQNWSIDNPFTTFEYLMCEDGVFNNIKYKKGDVLRYNSSFVIGKVNPSHISHVRVFN